MLRGKVFDFQPVVSDSMGMFAKSTVATSALALALMGGVAVAASPIAAATNHNVTATGGDGTAVDQDGTQGSFSNSVQGSADSDGIQDAFDMIQSPEASPQDKAPKATK